MRRWGVLISGRGSNLGALLDARDETFDISLVISSDPEAYGILRARRAGVPVMITPFLPSATPAGGAVKAPKIDWEALHAALLKAGITHLFLAGFMKIVPESFISKWERRILNLHPSLLPAYPGLRSIENAHGDGAPIGVTVHEVTKDVDAGMIVCQRRSLNEAEVQAYSLVSTEFQVHVDEQRMIKEAIRRWRT